MTVTAAQIAQLRRMVDEAETTTYDDDLLEDYIEAHPTLDERGEVPYTWDTSTQPPTKDDNAGWIPTYDLNATAADIWTEKAAVLAQDYDFRADGGDYTRSQAYEQAMKQARFWQARRKPGTIRLVMSPKPDGSNVPSWVIN